MYYHWIVRWNNSIVWSGCCVVEVEEYLLNSSFISSKSSFMEKKRLLYCEVDFVAIFDKFDLLDIVDWIWKVSIFSIYRRKIVGRSQFHLSRLPKIAKILWVVYIFLKKVMSFLSFFEKKLRQKYYVILLARYMWLFFIHKIISYSIKR